MSLTKTVTEKMRNKKCELYDFLDKYSAGWKTIPYYKTFKLILGSTNAAILLTQMIFHSQGKNYKPFYKFKSACDHEKYRVGDSWLEELGFTREEFDAAVRKIAYKKGKSIKTAKRYKQVKQEDAIFTYYTDDNRITWYEPNPDGVNSLKEKIEQSETCTPERKGAKGTGSSNRADCTPSSNPQNARYNPSQTPPNISANRTSSSRFTRQDKKDLMKTGKKTASSPVSRGVSPRRQKEASMKMSDVNPDEGLNEIDAKQKDKLLTRIEQKVRYNDWVEFWYSTMKDAGYEHYTLDGPGLGAIKTLVKHRGAEAKSFIEFVVYNWHEVQSKVVWPDGKRKTRLTSPFPRPVQAINWAEAEIFNLMKTGSIEGNKKDKDEKYILDRQESERRRREEQDLKNKELAAKLERGIQCITSKTIPPDMPTNTETYKRLCRELKEDKQCYVPEIYKDNNGNYKEFRNW